jgi:hypothetical protein
MIMRKETDNVSKLNEEDLVKMLEEDIVEEGEQNYKIIRFGCLTHFC